MNRSLVAFVGGVVLLAAFVVVLGPARLAATLAGADPLLFAVGGVAMSATVVCWSEGLRYLLVDAGGAASPRRVLVAYAAALLGRQILPMGAVGGPAITAFTVDREVSLSYNETLGVVIVAEFVSTVASLVLAGLAVPFLFVGPTLGHLTVFVLAVAGFAALLVGLAVAFWYRRRAVELAVVGTFRALQRTIGRASTRLHAALDPERGRAGLADFYGSIDSVAGNRRTLAVSFGYHQVGWLCSALPLYTSALALDVHVPLTLVVFLVPASHLVAVLPLPGGLGGTEIVLAATLVALLGIGGTLAAGIVLLYRVWAYWFLATLGAVASLYSAAPVVDFPPADR